MGVTISKRGLLLLLVVLAMCAMLNARINTRSMPPLVSIPCIRHYPNGTSVHTTCWESIFMRSDTPLPGHYTRARRDVAEDDQYTRNYYGYSTDTQKFRTSCRKAICPNVIGYPSQRINDAVNLVRRIMTSFHPDMVDKRKEIDVEVMNFHSRPQQKISNEDLEANVDGCSIRAKVKRPQEGISTDDERNYLIVNIPSLQQRVHFIECRGGKSKSCDLEDDSTCQQAYREERLLTLPSNVRRHYEARDFKIKKFRVPNGCQCGKGEDMVVNLA